LVCPVSAILEGIRSYNGGQPATSEIFGSLHSGGEQMLVNRASDGRIIKLEVVSVILPTRNKVQGRNCFPDTKLFGEKGKVPVDEEIVVIEVV
jgi:hypothetical protein